jgi:deoxyribodipyrimidine photo-lyase
MTQFPILTHAQLIDKVKSFDAVKYAKTRNYLNGGVSQLSPYITHGIITIDEIVRLSLTRYMVDQAEMWYKELLWREYFVQVHYRKGDGILQGMEEDKT